MRDPHWVCVSVLCGAVIIGCLLFAPHAPEAQKTNPRFVLQDLTERECVYDNISGKYISCWLKKDGP
jgi:hypothetical protein